MNKKEMISELGHDLSVLKREVKELTLAMSLLQEVVGFKRLGESWRTMGVVSLDYRIRALEQNKRLERLIDHLRLEEVEVKAIPAKTIFKRKKAKK